MNRRDSGRSRGLLLSTRRSLSGSRVSGIVKAAVGPLPSLEIVVGAHLVPLDLMA